MMLSSNDCRRFRTEGGNAVGSHTWEKWTDFLWNISGFPGGWFKTRLTGEEIASMAHEVREASGI
jgi:hypothetical protein